MTSWRKKHNKKKIFPPKNEKDSLGIEKVPERDQINPSSNNSP